MHRNSSLNNPVSLLSCFLCIAQDVGENKLHQTSARIESLQSLVRNSSHFFSSVRIQSYISFSACATFKQSVSVSISPYLSVWQNFEKKVIELQHFQISVLQDKEVYNGWFLLFNTRFGKLRLVKLIVDMAPSPKLFFLVSESVFSLFIYTATEWWL